MNKNKAAKKAMAEKILEGLQDTLSKLHPAGATKLEKAAKNSARHLAAKLGKVLRKEEKDLKKTVKASTRKAKAPKGKKGKSKEPQSIKASAE